MGGLSATILQKCTAIIITTLIIWILCVFYLEIPVEKMGPLLLIILGANAGGYLFGKLIFAIS